MLAWLDFFNFFFWIILLLFFFNNTNFLSLLLFSEFMWIFLYCLVVFLGSINDDLLLISLAFYFLGLAGVEFSFGFLLIIMFKHFNEPIVFDNSKVQSYFSANVENSTSKFKWI